MPIRVFDFDNAETTIGRAAMFLALTHTREEESMLREVLEGKMKFKCAVTEVGGKTNEFKDKIIHSVIGAALNCGVIDKVPKQVHALLHATMEAENGILIDSVVNVNLAVKIGIVSNDEWIAVAMFGQSGAHFLTSHERAGFGLMPLAK
jgi:hut operon positive regulator